MKKAAVLAGICISVIVASTGTANAGVGFSFGVSVGPAVPYGSYYFPAYLPFYSQGYYVSPRYLYPAYRNYVVPMYYNDGRYQYSGRYDRRERDRDRPDRRRGKSNPRSSRWR